MSFCNFMSQSVQNLTRCKLLLFNRCVKFYSTEKGKLFVERVRGKSLLRVSGSDAPSLLQGLITNDVNHLVSDSKAIYSMFLNNKGRIMLDSIIVKDPDEETYYIECDSASVNILEKHLKKYKLKKKVSLKTLQDEYSIYTVYGLKDIFDLLPVDLSSSISSDDGLKQVLHLDGEESDGEIDNLKLSDDSIIYRDPRLPALGMRVIMPKDSSLRKSNISLFEPNIELHKLCRYWLGIAEGTEEIPYEQCFPLETNCDYLHGVSFQKGCYIGQELTARSHHTGVIRKRVMPLLFETSPAEQLPVDITSENSLTAKKVGKLRGWAGKYGLALLRTAECLKLPHLYVGNMTARCFTPLWWPQESPKIAKVEIT